MRYWVYQDARVQGPFSKEDLASVQGLGPDCLVCKADSSSGAKEADWTSLADVPELAEMYLSGAGVGLAPAHEGANAVFEQFRKESEDILDRVGYPEAWGSGVFEDPAMFDSHAGLGGMFGEQFPADPHPGRTAELEGRLCQLQDQLEEYEKRTNEILDALGERDKRIRELTCRLEEAAKAPPVEAVQVPQAASVMEPAPVIEESSLPAAPEAVERRAFVVPSPEEAQTRERTDLATEVFAAPEIEAPVSEREAAEGDAPPPLEIVEGEAPATEILLGASAMPEAQEFIPPIPEDLPPLLEAAQAPALEPLPLEPPPLDVPPPGLGPLPAQTSGMEQPRTMVFGQPGTPMPEIEPPLTAPPGLVPTPGIMEPPLEDPDMPLTAPPSGLAPGAMPGQMPTPMPIPLGGMPTPMPGEMTPMPMMGQPDIPQTVLAGMGVGGSTTPIPGGFTQGGQSFEELMGKPATAMPELTPSAPIMAKTGIIRPPSPEETGDAQKGGESKFKKFQSKKFLIGLGAGGVVLAVLLVLFFQNPKQVQQMVEMSPERNASGDIDIQDQRNPFGAPEPAADQASPPAASGQNSPFEQRSAQPAPSFPPPQAEPAAPVPAAADASESTDFIQDDQVQAMEFVKNYVLSGAKGTIDGWLNYSFPPPNMPQWSAGAVSKDVWLVEYLVFKGPKSKKPEITYSFEVNLREQTLKAQNSKTGSLLAGSERLNKKAPFMPPSKQLQPLPGDEDDPGAGDSGNEDFNNPGGDGL